MQVASHGRNFAKCHDFHVSVGGYKSDLCDRHLDQSRRHCQLVVGKVPGLTERSSIVVDMAFGVVLEPVLT
jgi:hypothetical protein